MKVVSFPPVQTDALPLGQLGPVEPQHTHPPPALQILTSFAMSRTLFPHFTRFASITLGTGSISTWPDLVALLRSPPGDSRDCAQPGRFPLSGMK